MNYPNHDAEYLTAAIGSLRRRLDLLERDRKRGIVDLFTFMYMWVETVKQEERKWDIDCLNMFTPANFVYP